jgi:hypothetical protein
VCALVAVRAETADGQAPSARAPAGASTSAATGVVEGRVLGAGEAPVRGAAVRVLGLGDLAPSAAVSDSAGRFTLRGVPAGVWRLEVRRLGYAPRVVSDVVARAGKPAEVRVVLTPAPAVLAGATARPDYFPPVPAPALPVSAGSFTAEEIRRAPGVTEDPVRALAALGGVAPTTESRNDLVVRGGAPAENLFVVDGVEVPNVNHFGAQGSTGGGVSLLPADFVREAALSAGGFGARWGDRASAVAAFDLRDGARERAAGQLNVAATGASALAEGPLGGRPGGAAAGGSFLAGVRRSYLDLVVRALGYEFVPAFHDATLKVAFRPTAGRFARDELSWFAVGGRSTVTFNRGPDGERYVIRDVVAPNQTQVFTGLRWRRRFARGAATAVLGRTDARFATTQAAFAGVGDSALALRARTREAETQLRVEAAWARADGGALELGAVAKYADRLRYDLLLLGALRRDPSGGWRPLDLDTAFTAFRSAAYVQITRPAGRGALGRRLRASVGARVDHYAFLGDAVRLAPRASLVWAPDGRSAVTLAGGRYWQAPPTIWLVGDAFNAPAAPGGGVRPFRADHLVLGGQRLVRPDLQVRVEAYVKQYGSYPARVFRPRAVLQPGTFDNALTDVPFGLEPLASVGTGRVTGAELLVQKKLSDVPVYGVAALTVSRARFRGLAGVPVPSAFDAPVAATLLGGWRPGGGWELSARARAAAGAPTTPWVADGALGGVPDGSRHHAGPRRPPFVQLDARADRRFRLRGGRQLVAYVDVIDVTGRRNVYADVWSLPDRRPIPVTTLGVLPSVGLNWVF